MINKTLASKTKRNRIIVGILLILVGILVAFLLIKLRYDDCANRWINDLDGFQKKYDSVWDCFKTRSMGAVFVYLLLGFFSVADGLHLLFKKQFIL